MELPELLRDQMQQVPGLDWESLCKAHLDDIPVSIRFNPLKPGQSEWHHAPVPWSRNGVYLPKRPVFTLDPSYHAGAYYVQEASSMFVEHALRQVIGDNTDLRVLDLCAAPGGKSTLAASLLGPESLLIANEVIRSRATILDENMTRWGYENTWVTSNDPRDFRKLTGYFDIILVDAPCSGSGMFRKEPGSIDGWSEDLVKLCAERQQRILADVWPALKQDGLIIYTTCSFSPMENEHTLDWLSERYETSGIELEIPGDWGVQSVQAECGFPCYRLHPDRVAGEGFFLGVVRKNEEVRTVPYSRGHAPNDLKIARQASFLLQPGQRVHIATAEDTFSAIQESHLRDWLLLKESLYFRRAGIRVGAPAAKDWVPEHDVALSVHANAELPGIELDREQALRYLKREDFASENLPKGWLVVRYQGLGLGWVKSLGNRVNNHLPKNWRIRMNIGGQESECGPI